MSNKENLNLITKILKKINLFNNDQSLRDSLQDVIDEKSNDSNIGTDLTSKEKSNF